MGKKETKSIPPEYTQIFSNWKQMGNVERGKHIKELKALGIRKTQMAVAAGVSPRRVSSAEEAYDASLGKQRLKEILGR